MTGAETGYVRRNRDCGIVLLVPKRESARNDVHTVTFGPVLIVTRVSVLDVEFLNFNVASAYFVPREQLDYAVDAQIAQDETPELIHASVVEQSAPIFIGVQIKIFELIISRELNTILSRREEQGRSFARSSQYLPRRYAQHW